MTEPPTTTADASKNVYENQSPGGCAAPDEPGKEGQRGISRADMSSEPDAAMRSSPPAAGRESFHTRSKAASCDAPLQTPGRKLPGKKLSAILLTSAVVAVALIVAVVPAKNRDLPPQSRPPVNVNAMLIRVQRNLPDTMTLSAAIEPNRTVNVSAEVVGRVKSLLTLEGKHIDAYSGMVELDKELLQAEYDRVLAQRKSSEADLLRAKAQEASSQSDLERSASQKQMDQDEYDRLRKAAEKEAVSQIEVKQAANKLQTSTSAYLSAQASLKAAEASVAAADQMVQATEAMLSVAKTNRDRSTIKAPVSGILNDLVVEVGEYVTPGMKVAQIVDTDTVKVVLDVPEKDIAYVRLNDTVSVAIDQRMPGTITTTMPAERIGTVTYIASLADEATRTTRVEVSVDNHDGRLFSGQIVNATLTRRVLPEAILIPLRAVLPEETSRVVYVAENGLAQRKTVTLSLLKGQNVVVEAGLKDGDVLIIDNQQFVSPGQAITIRNDPASAASQPANDGAKAVRIGL